jgi:hypothetical protein
MSRVLRENAGPHYNDEQRTAGGMIRLKVGLGYRKTEKKRRQ